MKIKLTILLFFILIYKINLFAEDTKIDVNFRIADSIKYCNVKVINADTAVKGIEIKFFVKTNI